MPRKKRPQALTAQQRKLAHGIIKQGKTITEASRAAGYSSLPAASRAFKAIKLRFHPALVAAGYDVNKVLTDNFADLLAKKKAKKTEFFQNAGIVMDQKEVDDNAIQLRAITEVNRLIGAVATRPDEPETNTGYVGPAQVSITVVVADSRGAEAVMAVRPDDPPDHQQPALDATVDRNSRSAGPDPSL